MNTTAIICITLIILSAMNNKKGKGGKENGNENNSNY